MGETKNRQEQIMRIGGVFLIGLALLAFTGFWWPGILILSGVMALLGGALKGSPLAGLQGGLWMLGMGLIFAIGFDWRLMLVLIGLGVLSGKGGRWFAHPSVRRDRRKSKPGPRDEKEKRDEWYTDPDEVLESDGVQPEALARR